MAQAPLLIVPGRGNSEAGHWQTLIERRFSGAQRVEQEHWETPELDAWSRRIDEVVRGLDRQPLLVAHSFGCLATAHSLARDPRGVAGVLLVGPADPDKFGVAKALPQKRLPCPGILIASQTDPWMTAEHATQWGAALELQIYRWRRPGPHQRGVGPGRLDLWPGAIADVV